MASANGKCQLVVDKAQTNKQTKNNLKQEI